MLRVALVGRSRGTNAGVFGVLSETSAYSVTGVSPDVLDEDVLAAWDRLFTAQEAPSNPFLAPTWARQWYEKFVAPDDRLVLVVRRLDSDGKAGDVVAVVPMHILRRSLGPVTLARRLLPVGAGLGVTPYELPGVLCENGSVREIARALTNACLTMSVDWAELAFDPDQCWFEWEWLDGSTADMTFGECVRARACVILPLQPTWEETRATLKRNVKESVRRSANRLKKDGRPWQVIRRGDDLDQAVSERFLRLHEQRSSFERATSRKHPNAYEADSHRRMILDTLPQLGREGRASMFELYLDGEHVASQLALHSPGTSYVHSSGFREDTWELGVVTHLQAELIRYAVERGDTVVNFSPGPNVSKLRWSERLWITHEFAFGAGPRSLMARGAAFSGLSYFKALKQARSRHQSLLEARRT
jgi:CelD/BcsL family acetyltransferase involved in cellulose biosynthesis